MLLNSNTLKLAYHLAQYLYINKRLDLPGIGTFTLDPSAIIEAENSKQRSPVSDAIRFENNPATQEVPDLINYISSQTGKMKALASSDLESHLQLAQQFLNISKPFTFEGIGTLVKIKAGEYEFTPGNISTDKLKEIDKDIHGVAKKETVEAKYQAYLSTPVQKSGLRKPVVVLLILIGIGLAIWGGYTISTNRSTEEPELISANNTENTELVPDSSQVNKQTTDTITKTIIQPDKYKYVLEVCRAQRAFNRLKTLKDTKLADIVQLETNDSIQYKLFVLLPVSTDTTRIIDSLTTFLGRKVYIEHQN